jgi:hypothetical protein
MSKYIWSKSFYGVSHYSIPGNSIRGRWGTVVNRGSFTEAHISIYENDSTGKLKSIRTDENRTYYKSAIFFAKQEPTDEEYAQYHAEAREEFRSWGWTEAQIEAAFVPIFNSDPRYWGFGDQHEQAARKWVEELV